MGREFPDINGRPTQTVRRTGSPFLLPGDGQFLFYLNFVLLFFVPIRAMFDDQASNLGCEIYEI
jgi:hypothetical protein